MATLKLGKEVVRIPMESANSQWKGIETAPKDGTWVLCAWKNSAGFFGIPIVLYWHRGGQCWTDIDPAIRRFPAVAKVDPTHWMDLPQNPEE